MRTWQKVAIGFGSAALVGALSFAWYARRRMRLSRANTPPKPPPPPPLHMTDLPTPSLVLNLSSYRTHLTRLRGILSSPPESVPLLTDEPEEEGEVPPVSNPSAQSLLTPLVYRPHLFPFYSSSLLHDLNVHLTVDRVCVDSLRSIPLVISLTPIRNVLLSRHLTSWNDFEVVRLLLSQYRSLSISLLVPNRHILRRLTRFFGSRMRASRRRRKKRVRLSVWIDITDELAEDGSIQASAGVDSDVVSLGRTIRGFKRSMRLGGVYCGSVGQRGSNELWLRRLKKRIEKSLHALRYDVDPPDETVGCILSQLSRLDQLTPIQSIFADSQYPYEVIGNGLLSTGPDSLFIQMSVTGKMTSFHDNYRSVQTLVNCGWRHVGVGSHNRNRNGNGIRFEALSHRFAVPSNFPKIWFEPLNSTTGILTSLEQEVEEEEEGEDERQRERGKGVLMSKRPDGTFILPCDAESSPNFHRRKRHRKYLPLALPRSRNPAICFEIGQLVWVRIEASSSSPCCCCCCGQASGIAVMMLLGSENSLIFGIRNGYCERS